MVYYSSHYSLPINKKVYVVYTSYLDRNDKHFWNGFGPPNSSQLQVCFADRILLSEADINLGQRLWKAYKNGNLEELTNLSKHPSSAFLYSAYDAVRQCNVNN